VAAAVEMSSVVSDVTAAGDPTQSAVETGWRDAGPGTVDPRRVPRRPDVAASVPVIEASVGDGS
jgi:hypothetical protein